MRLLPTLWGAARQRTVYVSSVFRSSARLSCLRVVRLLLTDKAHCARIAFPPSPCGLRLGPEQNAYPIPESDTVTSISCRRNLILLATSVATALALTSPSWAQEPKAQPHSEASPAPAALTSDIEYVIGSGDVLNVFIWKEPDLTRNVTVRLDGKITVPLIGDLTAAGRSPANLAAEIRLALGRFISTPNVTVEVNQTSNAQFYVLGQVVKPGQFSMAGRVTVLQALALAGGFREFAKTEEIVVVRHEGDSQTFLPFNYKRVQSGRDPTQNLVLRPGDTILVP